HAPLIASRWAAGRRRGAPSHATGSGTGGPSEEPQPSQASASTRMASIGLDAARSAMVGGDMDMLASSHDCEWSHGCCGRRIPAVLWSSGRTLLLRRRAATLTAEDRPPEHTPMRFFDARGAAGVILVAVLVAASSACGAGVVVDREGS